MRNEAHIQIKLNRGRSMLALQMGYISASRVVKHVACLPDISPLKEGERMPVPSASSINVPDSQPPADRQYAYLTARFPLIYLFRPGDINFLALLARSPPTKANQVQYPAGSLDFLKWESCWTMVLVSRFSQGSLVSSALSLRRRSIFTSITFICSQYLAVKSHPNLLTHSVFCQNLERGFRHGIDGVICSLYPRNELIPLVRWCGLCHQFDVAPQPEVGQFGVR
ncbi:hypothetical protein PR048_013902 [Dryococelus australis]|uniref:Uncharacterized protein n=1 Tax=Dryococelus australis TaxID=614101 RepID=A0ABQ9HTH3_9NEOP|nr:hypothetical protein PR048_013902 [Dryococelus australis]